MTRAKKGTPLSSFGPSIRALLQAGSNRPVTVSCETENDAIHLVHRLNDLRSAMREEKHPDWEQVYRCIARRKGVKVSVEPRDQRFDKVLEKAKIPLTIAPEGEAPPPQAEGSDPAEDFLASLRKKDD